MGSAVDNKDVKGILGKSPLSQVAPVISGTNLVSEDNLINPISSPINCIDEDMKDSLNENGNLEADTGNDMKKEQGTNFLNMDFTKPVASPAAKLVSDYNKKILCSYG
ncbi:unnamed protein product [Lactuca saligna]|uniref:Uncharacterized protein n=1 Tax=Lactuca saligna TaxID=75948 RepID=A0AA35V4V8_LACSI|nr:unnamed protein product [Lactuca saligna]